MEEALAKLLEQAILAAERSERVRMLLGKDTALSVAVRGSRCQRWICGSTTPCSKDRRQLSVTVVCQWSLRNGTLAVTAVCQWSLRNRSTTMTKDASLVLAACLQELHLPAVKKQYEAVALQASAETWSYPDYPRELMEGRMPAAAAAPRIGAAIAGVEAAAGEELVDAGPEPPAAQGGAAVASRW